MMTSHDLSQHQTPVILDIETPRPRDIWPGSSERSDRLMLGIQTALDAYVREVIAIHEATRGHNHHAGFSVGDDVADAVAIDATLRRS